jgi:hypothetical protein
VAASTQGPSAAGQRVPVPIRYEYTGVKVNTLFLLILFVKPGDPQLRICLYLWTFAPPTTSSDGKSQEQNPHRIFTIRFTVKNVCSNAPEYPDGVGKHLITQGVMDSGAGCDDSI